MSLVSSGDALPPLGPVCHCGATTVVRFGKHGHFYSCPRYPSCDGIASSPTARVSTRVERLARMAARSAFDRLWKDGYVRREHAYALLAAELRVAAAHMADMDEATCDHVVAWSQEKLRELKRRRGRSVKRRRA